MAISASAQYSGGFLPDIIPWTQGYYHRGIGSNAIRGFVFAAYETVMLNT